MARVIIVYHGPGGVTSSGPPDVDVRITEHKVHVHENGTTEAQVFWEYA